MVAGGGSEWFWCLSMVPGGSEWFVAAAGSVRWWQVVAMSGFGAWGWFLVVRGGCC